jgi:hypothetical protein
MKTLIRKIKIPLSLFFGGFASYLLFANPLESYTLPVIIIWLPDVIGWDAFFVVLGIIAGLITFGICLIIEGEEN